MADLDARDNLIKDRVQTTNALFIVDGEIEVQRRSTELAKSSSEQQDRNRTRTTDTEAMQQNTDLEKSFPSRWMNKLKRPQPRGNDKESTRVGSNHSTAADQPTAKTPSQRQRTTQHDHNNKNTRQKWDDFLLTGAKSRGATPGR
jgi:hypothetical protein